MQPDRRCSQVLGACLLLGLVALEACGRSKAGAPAGPAAAPSSGSASAAPARLSGAPDPAAVVGAVADAFRGAGLPAEGFAPLAPVPYGAAYCEEGRIDTIDTVVCGYRDAVSLANGRTALLDQWGREGGHTGVAVESKLTLLGMFDRARHDPNGKTISKVVDAFHRL